VAGWRKVPGQQGYQRALAGFFAGLDGSSEALLRRLGNATRAALKDPALAKPLAVSQAAFEASTRKRVRELLGS
jgi:hypothetical protein